jgi:hypothetical protein
MNKIVINKEKFVKTIVTLAGAASVGMIPKSFVEGLYNKISEKGTLPGIYSDLAKYVICLFSVSLSAFAVYGFVMSFFGEEERA